ncbi:DNA-directed RNA polymerase II subunit RPB11 [Neolecta irregularis DAH-3]|uniref:DNA-directed RNA polymerase II subunit RPB11 n=1 Tax=Neolecta irregularis (strain DAH-3) TaxID=1198029 RepID=A0A1U7LM31_NEOID|nr:DNA-directed RNA polymerase II subunit RPB11 [Neolecta irregularis DAH-3]|eukprot:OLL23714.1 DNA-directed RNA polymerase II subunit RPB11 [Neolecta irregularis DAH-3]
MNTPDVHELYLLEEGMKKVAYTPDSKLPNTGTFKFEKEDHTLGNMLRTQLLRDPRVQFAAYRVPHPLNHSFVLRVQTDDGYGPKEAVIAAASQLVQQLTQLKNNFDREWGLKQISREGGDDFQAF